MSGALNPSGPSQPPPQNVFESTQNAASKEPAEKHKASQHAKDGGKAVANRGPSSGDDGDPTPSSLGRGIHGAGQGESGRSDEDYREGDLEGEQMRAPGEGETASAVHRKPGASGAEPSLTKKLDSKKEEQEPMREAMQSSREHGADDKGVDVNKAINEAHQN